MRETPFRRVVMRTNDDGRSVAIDTGPVSVRELDPIRERLEDTTWGADILTVAHDSMRAFTQHAPDSWQVEPPPAGAVFRVVHFAPHSTIDLHTTETIDVGVVISGEVWLTSEDGEVQLKPHD